jgi:hypothetical protein
MEDVEGVFDASPSVAAVKTALKSALKKPTVFHINMAQRGESKHVSYIEDDRKPTAKRKG